MPERPARSGAPHEPAKSTSAPNSDKLQKKSTESSLVFIPMSDVPVAAACHLAIARLGRGSQHRGTQWPHLPIPDVGTPEVEFEAKWPTVSHDLRSYLDSGENILIHCPGGVGRSGMVAARLLCESGDDAETAIARVRAARPGAIETLEQEQWARQGPRRSVP